MRALTSADTSLAAARARSSGLSLVEVMIALALLSVALIALIAKIHDCIDTARVTEYQNAAREYSKELMGEIEAGTIDGLFDGFIGDFTDRGYPQLRYTLRIGDGSNAGTIPDPTQRKLYDKPLRYDGSTTGTTATGGMGSSATSGAYPNANNAGSATDPDATTDAEEPYTRVQITVDYPTVSEDARGTYTLEKKLPTPNTKGSKGLEEQRERDAQAAATDQPTAAGTPVSGGNTKGTTNNTSKLPGK